MDETWMDVYDFPRYQVSDQGKVRNKRTHKIKSAHYDNDGYLKVTLMNIINGNKKTSRKTVHRLVAESFLGGPHPDLQVNHKNGVKDDNRVVNLEWCTGSENVKHAYATDIRKPSGGRGTIRPVRVTELNTVYPNLHECAKAIGSNSGNLSHYLHENKDTIKGYHVEYVDKLVEKPKQFLYDCQMDAVNKLRNGSVLCGGVGSGKSRTGLYYYFKENGGSFVNQEYIPMKNPQDLYIITTAMKRDTYEWDSEIANYRLSTDSKKNELYNNKIVIDSWNNIKKYSDVTGAFFLFDEQRVCGSGAWVKSFLKVAKNNNWILLSATPGDSFEDYIPLFIANGFYKNKTEFAREHIVYSRFTKYPQIDRYLNTGRLIRLRDKILVDIDFERSTVSHHSDVYCKYDIPKYKDVTRNRWDPFKNEPISQASQLCYILRRIVNTDESRVIALMEILEKTPRAIIFYNFDYEREMLLHLLSDDEYVGYEIAEWSGHAHQPVPNSERWIYLCQYTAGNSGWNCIKTDTIIFFSQNYSYKVMEQACGRIDRLNTPFKDLYYYHLKSRSGIDLAISKALDKKKKFNERKFTKWN